VVLAVAELKRATFPADRHVTMDGFSAAQERRYTHLYEGSLLPVCPRSALSDDGDSHHIITSAIFLAQGLLALVLAVFIHLR
jgi:hypothetical protein